ncbi:hypothetical protein QCN27_06255 [Cereibacter sp. SYSU M97828]|nr:hypothetical protein [Cereibacter flavus]
MIGGLFPPIAECMILPFATEFPIRSSPNRAALLAAVAAWLKGTNYSTILSGDAAVDDDGEQLHLRAESGEGLRFRVFPKPTTPGSRLASGTSSPTRPGGRGAPKV